MMRIMDYLFQFCLKKVLWYNIDVKITIAFMQIASKLQYASINPSRLNDEQRKTLLEEIDVLLENAWGKFDINFLENHTLISEQITVNFQANIII